MLEPARLAVFCGSRAGRRPRYAEAARAMGQCLVRRGLGLVYGGGSVGLMGVVADAALEAGGEVIGVIPDFMSRPEVAHDGLSELRVVDSMHTRKRVMTELSGGFVAMPGGIGTLEELFEVVSWAQLGLHAKPVGLLDVGGYWSALQMMLDAAVEEGFVQSDHRELLVASDEPEALVQMLVERAGKATPEGQGLDRT